MPREKLIVYFAELGLFIKNLRNCMELHAFDPFWVLPILNEQTTLAGRFKNAGVRPSAPVLG
jgi:hypothetical protein